ncbi:hypothetical protein VC83_07994 [Pseudogymnoascus destructans]|uniref:Radical SAM core domain-containing protein n=2 Tax=Pseudogymnoascus destructans TaxID=655981 RepID=L8FTL5_PSED2|nr:uncharacterized protein VC83_07994 [Pseudogymnoascus destructans]ELR04217.1 hypothetical protein GMDG_06632 [Pseudogymnoascus destructans 20631-21]OAF56027.1 hypothetical protein VC83_07994 [Pseudogymnoascus destructans]
MKLLKKAGMKKLNFAGGEPFLYPTFLRELLRYGKGELGIESISIVFNSSNITERFLFEKTRSSLTSSLYPGIRSAQKQILQSEEAEMVRMWSNLRKLPVGVNSSASGSKSTPLYAA